MIAQLPPVIRDDGLYAAIEGFDDLFAEGLNIQMGAIERTVLWALVLGLRPQRILEIGSHAGGSAYVMAHALNILGRSEQVCATWVARWSWDTVAAELMEVIGEL